MKHFSYIEQGPDGITVEVIVSDEDILGGDYYEHWQGQMHKVGRDELISPELCLEDWVAVNYACEVSMGEVRGGVMRRYLLRADWIDRPPLIHEFNARDIVEALQELTTIADALSGAAELTLVEIIADRAA